MKIFSSLGLVPQLALVQHTLSRSLLFTVLHVNFIRPSTFLLSSSFNPSPKASCPHLFVVVKFKMSKFVVLSGSSNPELSEKIVTCLQADAAKSDLRQFSNLETGVEIKESVRNKEVFIFQTAAGVVNDSLMEMVSMIDACKRSASSRITAVIPSYFYARQDKKGWTRAPVSARLVADMLLMAGTDHVITMDLHAPQIEGFFKGPLEHLTAEPAIIAYIRTIPDWGNAVIVAPDAGAEKRAKTIAEGLNLEVAVFAKNRVRANEVASMRLTGVVAGKIAVLVDDMADTCGTLGMAADKLIEAGATKVFAVVVHGIFSGSAFNRIDDSKLEVIACTNTLPQENNLKKCPKLRVIDVSAVFGEAIRRCHTGESLIDLSITLPCKTSSS